MSSCGLTTILLLITSLLLFLMIVASSMRPVAYPFRPKCVKRSYDKFADINLYLVHDTDDWQQYQLETLEEIATKYNKCQIELIVFQNITHNGSKGIAKASVDGRFKNLKDRSPYEWYALMRRKRQILKERGDHLLKDKMLSDDIDLNINVGAKKQLKAFLERHRRINTMKAPSTTTTTTTIDPPIITITDVVAKFPTIIVRNITKTYFFEESPLFANWKNLNDKVLIFAARILKLWESGGISFELPESVPVVANLSEKQVLTQRNSSTMIKQSDPITLSPEEENKIIKSMIETGYASFKNLPEGIVTVDEEGAHMETKTTCHAFFGEAIQQLQAATSKTTVPEIIRNTLKTFCDSGAVDSDYCNSIKT